jgi:4-hydroxy-3-polyprenylbenzoate decarboxylase
VIISIDKRYPMQARRMMSALWGLGQMSFVKTILVVDADVDVHDTSAVIKILLNQVDLQRDLFFSEGILDVLNHGSDQALYGSKLGIDATEKIEGESGFGENVDSRQPSQNLPHPKAVVDHYKEVKNCRILEHDTRQTVMFVAFDKTRPHQASKFISSFFDYPGFSNISILIVLEGHVDLNDTSAIMWKFFNNLDPKRDFHYEGERLGIDVTQKFPEEGYEQDWPNEIVMSKSIKEQVQEKWVRLFGAG